MPRPAPRPQAGRRPARAGGGPDATAPVPLPASSTLLFFSDPRRSVLRRELLLRRRRHRRV